MLGDEKTRTSSAREGDFGSVGVGCCRRPKGSGRQGSASSADDEGRVKSWLVDDARARDGSLLARERRGAAAVKRGRLLAGPAGVMVRGKRSRRRRRCHVKGDVVSSQARRVGKEERAVAWRWVRRKSSGRLKGRFKGQAGRVRPPPPSRSSASRVSLQLYVLARKRMCT